MKRLVLLLLLISALGARGQTFDFEFASGYQGWSGDFADYPASDSVFYELAFGRSPLPLPLDTTLLGLRISGNNHSDDLFMFIKRKVTGLLPNRAYQVLIEVVFASNVPTNAIGVGGAPGEGVTVKAGITRVEPLKVNHEGFYLMNIDKGNQVQPGADMDTIGNVGVTDTTTAYELVTRTNATHLFSFTTDSSGEAWICIGTDSGFEATTTLYYKQISLTFTGGATGLTKPEKEKIRIYPNPATTHLIVEGAFSPEESGYSVFDGSGRKILTGFIRQDSGEINIAGLQPGLYILRIDDPQQSSVRFLVR